ncbi:MAG: hypothetical protein LC650_03550 [Actinobacteria bacterium]|nr:hypothetical protein [Actinomycetota bacterium]
MKREAVCTEWHRHEFDDVKRGEYVTCPTCNEVYKLDTRNNNLLWGWRVTRDYLDPKGTEHSRHGKEYRDYQGGKHKYRLLDDDGTVYYAIEADTPPESNSSARLFAPLDWAMAYAGCSELQYRTTEGWRTL